jgi:hypothetical protein
MSNILIYQDKDGFTKIDVRLENETLWITQQQMADLFQTTKQNVSLHISNICKEGELQEFATVKDFLTVQHEGKRRVKRSLQYYNLDMIISVGYRIKSTVATHFRIWATQVIKEFLIKGFALDDERLKEARNNYFDELLERIRDIRTSEKLFYRKICDIFSTSIDYDPNVEITRDFFTSVQNKFHWAIHAHTAAELVLERADAAQLNMGLTTWTGKSIKQQDVVIAKNYLNATELDNLNRLVSQYLEFAELQAKQHKPMYMQDWLKKLHDILIINEKEILTHFGKFSHVEAEQHALSEFHKYQKQLDTCQVDELDKYLKRLSNQ